MFNDPEWASREELEAYAWFGFAISEAQAVESELLVIATSLSVVRGVSPTDAEWRTTYQSLARLTFGVLRSKVLELKELPDDLAGPLSEAVKRRNFLAHQFYWPRVATCGSDVSPEDATKQFMKDASLFRHLATRLEAVMWSTLGELRLTREDTAAKVADALSRSVCL